MSSTTYGGWVTERPIATGEASGIVKVIGWAAVAATLLTGIGTGGEFSLEYLQRSTTTAHIAAAPVAELTPVRTPREDLAHIREVLSPAVSDLANTFGVTRQSVYNWLNGEPVAEGNAAKLRDLAQAADVLVHEGITVNAALLKRKFVNGKTLLQVAEAGESARDAAVLLAKIHIREAAQRARMNTRFANRAKTPTTADFDLPAPNDSIS